jgi:hypothetical protein
MVSHLKTPNVRSTTIAKQRIIRHHLPIVRAASGSAAFDSNNGASSSSSGSGGGNGVDNGAAAAAAGSSSTPQSQQHQEQQQQHQQSAAARVRAWWANAGKIDKAKLAEYGLGAFAAYGVISNLNAGVLMTIAWLSVVRATGFSPLEGEWARFLGIYAGLWVGASFMRPVRLSLALAAAPGVNALLDAAQRRLRLSRGAAFGALLAMIAVASFVGIFGTIALLGGFPNGVPPLPKLPFLAAAPR